MLLAPVYVLHIAQLSHVIHKHRWVLPSYMNCIGTYKAVNQN